RTPPPIVPADFKPRAVAIWPFIFIHHLVFIKWNGETRPLKGGRDESDPAPRSGPHAARSHFLGREKENVAMKTTRVYRLDHLSPTLFGRLKAAQREAAQVWKVCVEANRQARMSHARWPDQNDLHHLTKRRFALHSQSVQAVFRTLLGTIETTRKLRKEH